MKRKAQQNLPTEKLQTLANYVSVLRQVEDLSAIIIRNYLNENGV